MDTTPKTSIITINETLLTRFDTDEKERQDSISIIDKLLENGYNDSVESQLTKMKEDLEHKIPYIDKDIYIAQTGYLIYKYKEVLSRPMNKDDKERYDTEKGNIETDFFNIASQVIKCNEWLDISLPYTNYNYENDTEDILDTEVAYRDYDRVNIVSKFAYSRVSHFQECIKQYQGKQNCKIPPTVFSELDAKFKAFRILVDSNEPEIKYSKVTRDHIALFLKQLGHTNQYENINYIYCFLTGKVVDDIEYIEHQLIDDFKVLANLYDKTHGKDKPEELKRKNFMNVQYILFQLLRNRGHKCNIKDFSVLKTVEKKRFHDDICSKLFERLGWNFTPTF